MCGRYTVYTGFSNPNYNASPGQFLPVLINKDNKPTLALMRWGLVPSWAQDDKRAQINARAESVTEKPMFKPLLKRHRCLVPTNGFYEWGLRNGLKWPFYFKLKNEDLFTFAGLYSEWDSPDGSSIPTYTIITTSANSLVKPVHDRMPSIIPASKQSSWLNPALSDNQLETLLEPISSDLMVFYPVSDLVNKSGLNTPELIKRL